MRTCCRAGVFAAVLALGIASASFGTTAFAETKPVSGTEEELSQEIAYLKERLDDAESKIRELENSFDFSDDFESDDYEEYGDSDDFGYERFEEEDDFDFPDEDSEDEELVFFEDEMDEPLLLEENEDFSLFYSVDQERNLGFIIENHSDDRTVEFSLECLRREDSELKNVRCRIVAEPGHSEGETVSYDGAKQRFQWMGNFDGVAEISFSGDGEAEKRVVIVSNHFEDMEADDFSWVK